MVICRHCGLQRSEHIDGICSTPNPKGLTIFDPVNPLEETLKRIEAKIDLIERMIEIIASKKGF